MIVSDKFINELVCLEENIHLLKKNNNISQIQLEAFLRNFEKRRYNILNQISLYNKTVEYNTEKIKNINHDYKSEVNQNILKIYIPEVMPAYKNLKTHAHKNILLNIIEVTKPFSNMFNHKVFIDIKIFDKTKKWDIDNKFIKLIPDALIASKVINDDNIDKMFYCVRGEFSEMPHTEVYVYKAEPVLKFLEEYVV